jgi:hypothetical protein
MAETVLTNATLWMAQYALHGSANSLAITIDAESQDVTTFGDSTRNRLAGLKSLGVQMDGYYDGTVDAGIFSSLMLSNVACSVTQTRSIGDIAYLFKAISSDYSLLGSVGQTTPFSCGASSTTAPVRGTLMENAAHTVTANGTGQQLGAVTSAQTLYSAVHVTAASGTSPTLDITIESDDNASFTSATTRATLSQITAAGSAWTTIAGAVTDDYWRYRIAVGGTTPSFTIAATLGIL